MRKEREQKRNFSLAISLVLVAAMFSFYLNPTPTVPTGQFYSEERSPVNRQPISLFTSQGCGEVNFEGSGDYYACSAEDNCADDEVCRSVYESRGAWIGDKCECYKKTNPSVQSKKQQESYAQSPRIRTCGPLDCGDQCIPPKGYCTYSPGSSYTNECECIPGKGWVKGPDVKGLGCGITSEPYAQGCTEKGGCPKGAYCGAGETSPYGYTKCNCYLLGPLKKLP